MNCENTWSEDILEQAPAVEGPAPIITLPEVRLAISGMKGNKAPGPIGVTSNMLKAGGDATAVYMTELINRLLHRGTIPQD
ncbi:hypothetical protein ACOMHN_024505 [Nucella lapillus]